MLLESPCRRTVANFRSTFNLLLLVLTLMVVPSASAQNSNDRGTPADQKKGQSTQSTYARDKIETVNLANGNFSLSIPLATVGGRGSASFTIALNYNSKVWSTQQADNGFFTGGEGQFRYIYSSAYDYRRIEDAEPYMFKLGGGWSILAAPGIKSMKFGIDPLTSGCSGGSCGPKYVLTKMWLTLPDGSQVELRDVDTQGAPAITPDTNGYHILDDRDRGRRWRSIDGSNVVFVRDPGYPVGHAAPEIEFPTGWVFLPDGTRMRMDQGVGIKVIDRQGNFISLDENGWHDQLGRRTVISGSPLTVTIIGDPNRSVTIDFGTIGDSANLRSDFHSLPRPFTTGDGFRDALDNFYDHTIQTAHTDLFLHAEGGVLDYGSEGLDVGAASAVTRLNLMDGRSLQFRYNQYGEVAEIVYPGGGVSQIDYGGMGFGNCEIQAPFGVNRTVGQRRTLTNGTNVDATWIYSTGGEFIEGVFRPAAIVDAHQGDANGPLLASEKHFFRMLNAEYRPCSGPYTGTGNEKWENGKEFRTEILTGTGTTVTVRDWQQRAAVVWANDVGLGFNTYANAAGHGQDQPPNDPRVMWEETTLEDGKTKRVEYSYDQFNNVTSTKEYDFGTPGSPGALLRQTFHTHLTDLNGYCYSNLNPGDVNCGTGLATDVTKIIYQPRLQLTEIVKDGNDNQRARTDFEYDNYAGPNHATIVANSNMIHYDGARFVNLPSATEPRGNVTKVTRWLDGGTDVVAYNQYDNAGQLVWNKDPNANVSTVIYSDNFGNGNNPDSGAVGLNGPTFAWASQATNAAGHVVRMQYDYWLGTITGVKDANNLITKTEYDALGRPFRETAALGLGEQSISRMSYPTLAENSARIAKQLDATRWLVSKTDFDNFDRPITSWQSEDGLAIDLATFTIRTNTVYDPLGRAKQVSDPYRPATETPVYTTTVYDIGGRVFSVTTPDTAVVNTYYNGNQVLTKDQAGKERMRETNALGNLANVWEILSAADAANDNAKVAVSFPNRPEVEWGYRTSYQYDTLDNLTVITQQIGTSGSTQTRSFAFDSLSRLKSSTNPENGTVCYGTVVNNVCQANGYDANGNLIFKTDARSVLSTYAYDVLNRNTSIAYSNDPAATPGVVRSYDGATKGIGRLWFTQTATTYSDLTAINSYDAMGRTLSQTEEISYNPGGGSVALKTYTTQRTYDLAGHPLTQTYPSGHTVTYAYDAAGRTSSFAGNLGDAVTRTYSSGMVYSAQGALTKEQFGTDTPIFNKLFYNVRGQLAEIRESTSYTGPGDTTWDRGAIINHFGNEGGCWGASCNAPDNNGNLRRQEVYIPQSSGGGYDNYAQYYDYDSLNRLKAARETHNSPTIQWQQQYAYDRYGNRTIDQANTTANVPHPLYTADATNNRLLAPAGFVHQYDSAGNQTTDTYTTNNPSGGQRTYDAENRMATAQQFPTGKSGTTWATYTYDGDGRRVRRKVYGAETWFVYGIDGELVAEYPATIAAGSPTKEYGHRNGQLLVRGQAFGGLTNAQWLVTDQLGTPRMVFDKTGSLAGVVRHDYLPFGEDLAIGGRNTAQGYTASDGVRQQFTQKERDTETSLDYFVARYYASGQGRFTSVDPIHYQAEMMGDPQRFNLYTYVRNNPLKFIDPEGEAIELTGTD